MIIYLKFLLLADDIAIFIFAKTKRGLTKNIKEEGGIWNRTYSNNKTNYVYRQRRFKQQFGWNIDPKPK